MEKTYHLLNPQANPHFLDLVAREIFILVSSETGSWKLESDLKKVKLGYLGIPTAWPSVSKGDADTGKLQSSHLEVTIHQE